MYKRFVKGNDNTPNRYIKTVMADNLNIDLKDNDGGFNCGKPAGYIQDFKLSFRHMFSIRVLAVGRNHPTKITIT